MMTDTSVPVSFLIIWSLSQGRMSSLVFCTVLSTSWPLLRKIRIDIDSCLVWIKPLNLTCKFAVAEKEEKNYSTIADYCFGEGTYCHKCIEFLLMNFKVKVVSYVSIWIRILKYCLTTLNISPEGGLVSLNCCFFQLYQLV